LGAIQRYTAGRFKEIKHLTRNWNNLGSRGGSFFQNEANLSYWKFKTPNGAENLEI